MTTRRKKPESPLAGKKARVSVERGGACIVIEDVTASEAGLVLADLLSTFRLLARTKHYPELRDYPDVVPGGSPVDVTDDDYADEGRRRVGF